MFTNNTQTSVEVLSRELDRAYTSLNGHYSLLLQLLVATTTLIGGVVAFLSLDLKIDDSSRSILIFLSPLIVVAIIGAAIVILYQIGLFLYFIRDISSKIRQIIAADDTITYYDKDSFPSSFQSPERGSRTYNIIRFTVIVIPIVLYIGLIGFGFSELYKTAHFIAIIFGIIYAAFFLWMLSGFVGVLQDLPNLYTQYTAGELTKPLHSRTIKDVASHSNLLRLFLARPVDFVSKAPLFFVGAVIAYFEGNITYHPKLLSLVFSSSLQPPQLGTVLYLLLWFAVQEGLIQQAKYIWNDIRDRNRDKLIPANQKRPVAQESTLSIFIYFELFARWGGGLVFAYLLSSHLLTLAALISIFQIAYELMIKPNSARLPLAPMFNIATGSMLRFLGGALAMGWSIMSLRLFLYAIAVYLLGVAYSATMWRVEAGHFIKSSIPFQRGQSSYFYKHGLLWLVVCAILLVGVASLFVLDAYYPPLEVFLTGAIFSSQLWLAASTFILTGILCCLFVASPIFLVTRAGTTVVTRLTRRQFDKESVTEAWAKRLFSTIKTTLLPLLGWAIAIGLLVSALLWRSPASSKSLSTPLVFTGIILFVFVQYWSIDYEQFSLIHLQMNLPIWLRIAAAYLFTADSGIKLPYMLGLLWVLNSSEFSRLIKRAFGTLPRNAGG